MGHREIPGEQALAARTVLGGLISRPPGFPHPALMPSCPHAFSSPHLQGAVPILQHLLDCGDKRLQHPRVVSEILIPLPSCLPSRPEPSSLFVSCSLF